MGCVPQTAVQALRCDGPMRMTAEEFSRCPEGEFVFDVYAGWGKVLAQ